MSDIILLVDDEAILLLSLKQSLRTHFGSKYRFETALNATQGLQILEELTSEGEHVAFVISDWLMPGMTGAEFLASVHQLYPAISLIMLTGHAEEKDMAQLSGKVKLEAFLQKPWDPERLFNIISCKSFPSAKKGCVL